MQYIYEALLFLYNHMLQKKIITIVGPTASGKSDFAVAIARYINAHKKILGVAGAEIISADSRQVYRGLNIGAGKITVKEMKGIPHHLLDVASPSHTYTVARYQKAAQKIITQLQKKNIVPILCGGTGFYIDAVLYGYIFPAVKPNVSLRKKLETITTEKLFALLSKKDPTRAALIDHFNRRRLIRALEIIEATKKPIPPLPKQACYNALIIGIRPNASTLTSRIHTRLIKRMKQGMVVEVRRLHRGGISWKRLDSLGLEYRFIARFLQGIVVKQDMLLQLESEINKFAKRQMTWFKKNKEIVWMEKADVGKAQLLVKKFLI